MRKLFVAGNWKMNLDEAGCRDLARRLAQKAGEVTLVRLAVCPPSVYLRTVADTLEGCSIDVGAQNMHCADEGAFTGEVSGAMLLDVGCRYVILGHSERRHIFHEPDELINAKTLKAIQVGLEPIVCVGEKLEQREAGKTIEVVSSQVRSALNGVTRGQMSRVTVAYEPVWAIGTGKTATPQQAEEVHVMIRGLVAELYEPETAQALPIQYGGSVKPDNATELLGMENIDGALVGGASLKEETFMPIIEAALSVSANA